MSGGAATPLRWGILSTARIVEELLPGFAAAEAADLRAIASRDGARAEAYAGERGIPVSHGSYEELLGDDSIDCVYIPLPNHLHGEWTRKAIEAGKNVLCEKPLTPTSEEATALFDLAEERGVLLMEAFMYRHHPKTKRLREIVAGGEIGEPVLLRSWFHFQVEDPETDIRYEPGMAGGALRDVGCYCVSLAAYLTGRSPEELGASARIAPSGVDEVFAATLGYGGGPLAVFDCGMTSPLSMGAEVLGTRGRARVATPWYPHLEPVSIEVEAGGGTKAVPTPGANAYQLEIENVCAAVRGEAPPEIGREETLENLKTIERLIGATTAEQPVAA
jgi:xylose dehydrogenase (NAD/NADP)